MDFSLWDQIVSFTNLELAYKKARLGCRFTNEVLRFTYYYERNMIRLQKELQSGNWQPGKVKNFVVYEPKRREIEAPSFKDRIVHHALCNIIMPILENGMSGFSYACRKGKGNLAAVKQAQRYSYIYSYVMQCDIANFFASIDIVRLGEILARKINDVSVNMLIQRILNVKRSVHHSGLPLGFLTSQVFANVYLTSLDDFIKRSLGIKGYIRYMDDFLLFSSDKQLLNQARRGLQIFLSKTDLSLKIGTGQIYPTNCGIPFLGYRIFPSHILLKKANINRFRRRISQLEQEDREKSLCGWQSYAMWADVPFLYFDMMVPDGNRRTEHFPTPL